MTQASRAFETLRTQFAVQADKAAPNTFRGMASVYHTLIDAWMPTRILPGAFTKTLADKMAKARVKILWQHDQHEPIGLPTEMLDTASGLEVVGKISETTRGKDALILLNDGVVSELSIGFDPTNQQFVQLPDGTEERHIHELDLFEFSLVTFAANPDARIMSVHARRALEQQPADVQARVRKYFDLRGLTGVAETVAPEAHAGKVLSAKNKDLVASSLAALQAASDALTALAAAAADPDPDDTQAALPLTEPTAAAGLAPAESHFASQLRGLELDALSAGVIA